MSVLVNNLTKKYGNQKAINKINFGVKKGEILGFLGPNGAGKTTTMKIISCFIPPTEGTVKVCDYDIQTQSMEVRRCIGYLPEHNPLYLDMYVKEYLSFAASLHKLGNKTSQRIKDLITLTGLGKEQHKKIGQLSKGYRQRVGIAQAMIHDPQVLILDEPTSGLDPNQLAEIRGLIRNLGKEKTVILSTHIMQEVQAMCDRVIIIDKGIIVADDTAEQLQIRSAAQSLLAVEFAEPVAISQLEQLAHVQKVEALTDKQFRLYSLAEHDIRALVFNFAVQHQYTLLNLHQEKANLETIFRQLTRQNA